MTVKYLFFYATPTDVVPLLRRFEQSAPLKFIVTDISQNPNRAIYLESTQLPHPGMAAKPTGKIASTYMVSHRETKNQLYSAKGKDGRTFWSLRNGDNTETVLLDLGGISSSGVLLEGQMTTMHGTRVAQQLMRWFLSALKKQNFVRFKGCWIGPAALDMLKAGKRLTQAEQSPPEYDLKWPGPA